MEEHITPPWADELTEDEFISYCPSYSVGDYFDLYDKDIYQCDAVNDIPYYIYDPTKHGYKADKKYPLLIWLHGATNALEGEVCINYSGAELFASPDYQKVMGGAYVLVPLANERRLENGDLVDSWSDKYVDPLIEFFKDFVNKNETTMGPHFVFGNSSGAAMSFMLTTKDPKFFNACIPIGIGRMPEEDIFDIYDENDVHLFYAISRHDEFYNFSEEIEPHIPRLEAMKHSFLYFPKWTKNGDGGVASTYFGCEMGQHCIINTIHANIMLADGTPLDERLPEGILGWIKETTKYFFI